MQVTNDKNISIIKGPNIPLFGQYTIIKSKIKKHLLPIKLNIRLIFLFVINPKFINFSLRMAKTPVDKAQAMYGIADISPFLKLNFRLKLQQNYIFY